jgi:hypothetical protein
LRTFARPAVLLGLGALLSIFAAACGNQGTTTSIPKQPSETFFQVAGDVGTPFSGIISDSIASWSMRGAAPFSVVIVNNQPPVRMVVTKLSDDQRLLSLEIAEGHKVLELASTTASFGVVQVERGQNLHKFAPAANPDIRIFVKGPFQLHFNGLIEDLQHGFLVNSRGPALFLFENPDGRVVGSFTLFQLKKGPLDVDLIDNGVVVASDIGSPTAQVKAR